MKKQDTAKESDAVLCNLRVHHETEFYKLPQNSLQTLKTDLNHFLSTIGHNDTFIDRVKCTFVF